MNNHDTSHEYFVRSYQHGSDIWTHIPYHDHVIHVLPPVQNSLVLDIGCGRGELMMMFLEKKAHVIGIDYVSEIISAIHKNLEHTYQQSTGRAIEAHALSLPFVKHSFDIITDIGTFQHIDERDRPEYIQEITRTLKTGGYYLNVSLSTNTSSFLGFTPKKSGLLCGHKFGISYYFFNPEIIHRLFQHSFHIIDSREYTYPSVSSPDDEITLLYTLMQKKNDS
jgi:cyclopropane fatty-acyl-phospholipid synthase-like methyltransferase